MRKIVIIFVAVMSAGLSSRAAYSALSEEDVPVVYEAVVLNEEKASQFVNSLDELPVVRGKLGYEGKDDPLKLKNTVILEKNYAPYRHAVLKMKSESPEHYAAIEELAEKYKFTSAEDWAETADGVMLTYYYIQQEKDGRTIQDRMKEQLRPEMLKMIPKDQMYRVEEALRMTSKINDVPEENERIVRGLLSELEVGMRKNL